MRDVSGSQHRMRIKEPRRKRSSHGQTAIPDAREATSDEAFRRDRLRLLKALSGPQAFARPDPSDEATLIVRAARGGVSLGGGRFSAALAKDLVRHDLACWSRPEAGRPPELSVTEAGRAHLRRQGSNGVEAFRGQHGRTEILEVGSAKTSITVEAEESPLDWLRRRRGRDGEPLIDAASYEAGERLRRDLTLAGMLPSVTMGWTVAPGGSSGGSARGPAAATDAVIAARQRATQALEAVGPDFADLLIDLCGFCKGLEVIERERQWPPRSAKVVVRLALARLADHYGFERSASGPAGSRGIRAWQALTGAEPGVVARSW